MPSADKMGISAAERRSADVDLSLEEGSEMAPVASMLSFWIEGASAESLMG